MIAGKTITGKTGAALRILKYAGVMILCLGCVCFGDTVHQKKAAKKAPQLPPLPSGPTGPVPQIPLDSIAPVMPTVSYDKGQLTIVAPNSTLGDILRAVRKQTGADIDVPDAKERVVTHLGPGPAREVIADLLNGSRFNYVLLGSPEDGNVLSRVVLVAKSGPDKAGQTPGQPDRRAQSADQQAQDSGQDAADAEAPPDENADDNNTADQAPPAEVEQPTAPPADQQQGVKTPQQLLQEMQQRQMQMQQQYQQQGQPGQQVPPPTPQQQ